MRQFQISWLLTDKDYVPLDLGKTRVSLQINNKNEFNLLEMVDSLYKHLQQKLPSIDLHPSRFYLKKRGIQTFMFTKKKTISKYIQSIAWEEIPANYQIEMKIVLAQHTQKSINLNNSKSKEKTLKEAIDLIHLQRQIYRGIKDENGQIQKLGLEKAAQILGANKKTLDD